MKTPREVLLRKHAHATPELDAMSAGLVRQLKPERGAVSWWDTCVAFMRSPRMGWSTLAAAWLVIIALNVASRESSPKAEKRPHRHAVLDEALREQKRLYAELIGLAARHEAPAAEPPPRPQSARRPEMFFA